MRIVVGLVLIACVLHGPVRAQEQAPLDPLTSNDALADTLWRIAAATNTRIGFESTDHVRMGGLIKDIPPLAVSTLDAALDASVAADGRYEWRRLGEGVVVRPKGAWDDRSDPLNRTMQDVHVINATPSAVLLGLRDFIYTGKFAVDQRRMGPLFVSFDLRAGTVVDALNELMVAGDQRL